jgi:hypothetical protein
MDTCRRKRFVTEHAVTRLRERQSRGALLGIDHRDDEDMCNKLDQAMCGAYEAGTVEWIKDNQGHLAAIADISDFFSRTRSWR